MMCVARSARVVNEVGLPRETPVVRNEKTVPIVDVVVTRK